MPIKYFSMFSGIGGFELGMEKSKHEFECIGFSEVDKYAISIYTRQFPKHRNFGDATRIDPEELEDFSILVGGFPCQAFSIAGQRRGFNDTRGTLFFEIARVLAVKKPAHFLLENVKGLLSHDGGRTFQTILKVCDDLGYDVSWQVYNSKDYGVPQSRERLYIKGYFRGRCGSEILSLPRTSTETDDDVKLKQLNNDVPRSFGDRVYSSDGLARTLCGDGGGLNDKTGLYEIKTVGKINDYQSGKVYGIDGISPTLCAGYGGLGARTGLYYFAEDNVSTPEKDPKIEVVANLSPTNHPSQRVISPDGICGTLTATDYKHPKRIIEPLKIATATKKGYDEAFPYDGVRLDHPDGSTGRGRVQKDLAGTLSCGGNWGTVDQDFMIRRLTPIECERLQGFPDDWTKFGSDGELISDTQRYKCCGNAVTVNVIQHIFDHWDLKV